jgi:excisionase family DNA binding protein
MPGEKQWITVTEAAEKSGTSIRSIQRWLQNGWIEGWKPGHDWFTTLEAVLTFKENIKRGRPKKAK